MYFSYGLVLLSQRLRPEARDQFVKCVNELPAFWPAWFELAQLIDTQNEV
jgi:hypothetical protein